MLPRLLPGFEPTRVTLHAYALVAGAVPRAHAEPLPHWWHLGLVSYPDGLVTAPVPLPGGAMLRIRLDLRHHEIVLVVDDGAVGRVDMCRGLPATALAAELFAVTAGLGLADEYDRTRFDNDDPCPYDPEAAHALLTAFTAAETLLARHRAWLLSQNPGTGVGPIHVWPHHFDMSFEWFGRREAEYDGDILPSQLNLGFDPTWEPYFYSTPWPLDPVVAKSLLPHGAVWHSPGWEGAMLPYETARQGHAVAVLTDFARAVFEAAEPTL